MNTMSVQAMRKWLGLGKTESYWLVKKGYFRTFFVAGKMRVDMESFEEWYANQFHYKKVTGEPPGSKYSYTMSITEMARNLGISSGTGYNLVKRGYFETVQINGRKRVVIESFEKWYAGQSRYKKVAEEGGRAACAKKQSVEKKKP